MKKLTVGQARVAEASFELGKVLGQRLAFGTTAGRRSAVQAAAIRQARNRKVHLQLGLKWREFCPKHLKMSGSQADQIIRLCEEFGPGYFEHTQTVRISADMYRLVLPFIADKMLHVEGEVLELNSANVRKAARAVRESRCALLPPAEARQESLSDRLAALDRRVTEIVAELREVAKAGRAAGCSLASESLFRDTFIRLGREMQQVAMENGIV